MTATVPLHAGTSPSRTRRSRLPAVLVACAGAAVTTAACLGTGRLETRHQQTAFRARAAAIEASLQMTVDLYSEELRSVVRFYAASQAVESGEFRLFVAGILSHRVAVQALIWAPREQTSRYPIRYLEPSEGGALWPGLDLGADPAYAPAFAEASDTGNMVATAPILVGGGSHPPVGVAFVAPIYRAGTPLLAGQSTRRENLQGFVVAALRADDLVAEAVAEPDLSGLRLRLYDQPGAPEPRLLGSFPTRGDGEAGAATGRRGPAFTARLFLPQREWIAVLTPSRQYLAASRPRVIWSVFALGLVLTVLSTAYVSALISRAAWAGRLVAERTAELTRANEELRVSEERFRLLVQTMKEGLAVLDQEHRLRYVNDAFCRMLGYPGEEMLGHAPSDFMDEDSRETLREQLAGRPAGDDTPYELTWRARDGRGVHTIVSPRPRFDPDGRYLGSFAVITDITGLKQTRDELNRTLAELRRSNAELEAFAYIASHDLQEPLRKVRAFGDRLATRCADVLDESGRDYLARMQNAAERMQTLINDLLAFSRVTTRARPFEPVDLAQVAREVVSDLEARLEQVGGRVEIGDLPTLEADPLQMRQLLQNLISNALKFHREGVPPVVTLRASVARNRSGYEIVVEDNGIGFDMKHAERIFGMFQRLHGRDEYEGTGVGLAICRKTAERHGGAITAVGAPGEGAAFTVTLPVGQAPKELTDEPPS